MSSKERMKEIIEFAIDNEKKTYEFYIDVVKKVGNRPELVELFNELALEEKGHEKFLQGFLDDGTVEKMHLEESIDYNITEDVDEVSPSTDMSFKDAIALAIQKEEEAVDMYQKLADSCKAEDDKNLFSELVKMELMHKTRLEDIYVNVAYAEVW